MILRVLPLLAAAAAGAGGVALVTAGDDRPAGPRAAAAARYTAPDRSFSIALPKGWRAVASGPAATVLARGDRRGVVVVRRRPAVRGGLTALAGRLDRRLRRDLPGAPRTGARFVRAGGRRALLTTFSAADRVQAIAVVPAGATSFSLDLVAPGADRAAARQLGTLVRSFHAR